MNELQNIQGALEEREVRAKDYRVGGISGADRIVIREDGDYRDFLPEMEYQIGVYFDTLACVTFSALNCIETIAKVKGMNWNRSDRFTAKMSGTTRQGNYLAIVAESISRDHGTVEQESWPFPDRQREPVFEWDDFYIEIPETVKMEGRRFLQTWKVQHEWVPTSEIRNMMKYGAIQVTVQAWPNANADGLYENRESNRAYNHAVELIYACDEYYEIYDHYSRNRKKLVPNYKFGAAKRFTLKKIDLNEPSPMITLPNNALIQQIGEGATGAFALHLDGKLLIGETDKVLASWALRSSDFSNKRAITKEQWDSFKHLSLKGEPLN